MVIDDGLVATELLGIDLCFNDALWVIDDIELGFVRNGLPPQTESDATTKTADRVIDARK